VNILTFNYEYPPVGGGGGVAHEAIAEELAKRHRVVVLTSATNDLPRRETRKGVEIVRVPVLGRNSRSVASLPSLLSYPPRAWRAASQLLEEESFDLVNGHFAVPTGPASLPVARRAGIPHVLSIHGGDIYDPSKRLSPHRWRVLRRAVRAVLERSDEVVAQSHNTEANARRFYDFQGPIRIIPLGLHLPDPPEVRREDLGLPDDRFIFITVGRLVPRKAVDRLLQILARVPDPRAYLLVVGSGPELETLRGLTRELGVEDRVGFTGWIDADRKWKLLRASDAFISTSLHEGFGLVFLEAMAMGLPVIAPDHGGQVDFLEDGETGYITPAGNEDAVAGAIARLMSEPGEAARMGAANIQRADRYRAARCAAQYEALFEEVMGRERSRA
jgi:glycosyltransferase involved in cell wall biosynthesis